MKDQVKKITDNIEKVVVNAGIGKMNSRSDFKSKVLPSVTEELSVITGQKPSQRPSRKSIAGFTIREGNIVGLKVTLRGKRMADFITRVISVVLPRVRDFKGLDLKNVDKNGNLNIGFKDQLVFPEIDADKSEIDFGLQVTAVPKNPDREEAIKAYREIGVPLKAE